MQRYGSTDTATASKYPHFILSEICFSIKIYSHFLPHVIIQIVFLFSSYYTEVWRRTLHLFLKLLHFTLHLYPKIFESYARRHQIPFLNLWYDSTWNWTLVSQTNTQTILPNTFPFKVQLSLMILFRLCGLILIHSLEINHRFSHCQWCLSLQWSSSLSSFDREKYLDNNFHVEEVPVV